MRFYLSLFALLCLVSLTVHAQNAGLRVSVTDPHGAFVPGAVAQLQNAQGKAVKSATTNQRGEATLNAAAGEYALVVTAPGFAPHTQSVRLPLAQAQVRLEVAAVEADVAVDRDKQEAKTDPRGDAFTNVLNAAQIAQLPDDPEEFEQAIRNLAGPGASFRVNGFGGGRLPPKTPYNVTTGFDNNGDTNLNDRPAGVRRNNARGAGRFDLSTRLSWGFGFGTVKETGPGGPQVRVVRGDSDAGDILGMGGMPGGKPTRYHMEFFLQATNLLNRSNLANFVGVQTSPFFGRATAALPGRRIETGLRFTF